MLSKAQIKLIQSLGQKKYRKQHKLFAAEGTKIAEEFLRSNLKLTALFALGEWLQREEKLWKAQKNINITEVAEADLKRISFLSTPQEVLVVAELPQDEFRLPPLSEKIVLGLESIRDPGNLGAMIRIADWYGLKALYCSDDCTDAFSPKVVQASMGSLARVKIYYCSLKKLVAGSKRTTYAATLSGEVNVHQLRSTEPCLILIGNEGQGLSEELVESASNTVRIPRFGKTESLNAALAAGILIDNFKRIMD